MAVTHEALEEVPGWFPWVDQELFRYLLADDRCAGDLVEVGVYLGRSAILIGDYRRAGERFTVCDLFEDESPDHDNAAENARSYSTLTRERFEQNYLRFHEELPAIVQGLSELITENVAPASARFVHIDASHLYEHVRIDVASAKTILAPGGVVVFDDIRSPHTPGVSAAVWEAVANDGLKVIALTATKLYGTFDGSVDEHHESMRRWLKSRSDVGFEVQQVSGGPVLRIWPKPPPPAPPSPPPAPPTLWRRIRRLGGRILRALRLS